MDILNWILHMGIVDTLYLIVGIAIVFGTICSVVGTIKEKKC